ncbi:MAG TPA: SDR family NAD(P)-dependent oxidoreductase [Gaiellaceae bacterium]|jgi:NAD(P)-dependent dehydrogenase (short-subunit alcohol dehydrogenase family)
MRVAVVTGASSGIGAALCRELRSRGWRVVGLSRRPAPEADEHEECDVADRGMVEVVASNVIARHPQIDLLVNNAGMPARGGFLDVEPERIESVVDVNYLGGLWCLRAFLPALASGSTLVNVVSVAGAVAGGPYSASKHAQLAFSRSIGNEIADRGISVLGVLPGFVETPGFPQRGRLGFLMRAIVIDPPLVAKRTIDAVEAGKHEIVVPRFYRPALWAQALAPGILMRRRLPGVRV